MDEQIDRLIDTLTDRQINGHRYYRRHLKFCDRKKYELLKFIGKYTLPLYHIRSEILNEIKWFILQHNFSILCIKIKMLFQIVENLDEISQNVIGK